MKFQKLIALALVAALSGCATAREAVGGTPRPFTSARPSEGHAPPATGSRAPGNGLKLATLNRAAKYPWLDGGRCAVEASPDGWEMVARRCYRQFDLTRIKFVDPAHQSPRNACSLTQASSQRPSDSGDGRHGTLVVQRALLFDLGTAGATAGLLMAADVPEAAGICMLLLPEVAGVVIVVGAGVVVGFVIVEAITELSKDTPRAPEQDPASEPKPDVDPLPPPVDKERTEKKKPGRIYVTYTKINTRTNLYYSGRTSMVVDLTQPLRFQAQAAVDARDANHHVDEDDEPSAPTFGRARLDQFDVGTAIEYENRYADMAYLRIRGREQQLIDYHGGAQSDTGKPFRTENGRRGVGKENPQGRAFHDAATSQWGELCRYTGY